MFACNLDDFLEDFTRLKSPCGVVRIDNNDCFCARGNLAFDILNIGVPIGFLIAKIVDRVATSECCACGPKRIVRAGDKNLVSVILVCLDA